MRIFALVLVLAACGGPARPAVAPPAVAAAFSAARWIPAKPTYLLAARTVGEAQHALHDGVEWLGTAVGVEPRDVSRELQRVLGVDPLDADAVGALGIELGGGIAMFSEDLDPTFVVHLASPEALQTFLDHQRKLGLVTQSVVVDGTEVFTARISRSAAISWAIEKDWLWLHVALGRERGTAWFAHSHRPGSTAWTTDWGWAQQLASRGAGLVGFVALRDLLATASARIPPALACAQLFQPVGRVGVAVSGDGHHASARLSFDLGPAAQGVVTRLRTPPPGWAAVAATAPFAVQWNLDVQAALAWLAPCTLALQADPSSLAQLGVNAGRALLLTFDPGDDTELEALRSATGAVSIDLSRATLFHEWLDAIPARSKFESDRTYGAYRGHHVGVPFVISLDYVLDDHVALLALGDGLLDRIANGPPPAVPPLLAIDLRPPGLPAAAWQWLAGRAGLSDRKHVVERLMRWAELRIGVTVANDALVIEASGNRR